MKGKWSTIILLLVLFTGLSLLLYPTASDYWNSFHQTQAIAGYAEAVSDLDDTAYEQCLAEAWAYNAELPGDKYRYQPSEEEHERYESLLNVSGNGIMGYVEVPVIGVSLPIYHGVEDTILQIAIGHIEGSSLPVGGSGTHCVISGHRGLPSARLFSDLDKVQEGDLFLLHVLDETLTYEVDQIRIVEPQETELLEIEAGQDLCTLVTCTPYGINSHRILVRGHRVENRADASDIRVTADAILLEPAATAPVLTAPVLLLMILWVLLSTRKRRR